MTGVGQGSQGGAVTVLWSWGEKVAGSGKTKDTRTAAPGTVHLSVVPRARLLSSGSSHFRKRITPSSS